MLERSISARLGAVRAEILSIEGDVLPERATAANAEMIWLLYEESLSELGLTEGPWLPSEELAGVLMPRRAVQLSQAELLFEELPTNALPEWARPYLLHLPCSEAANTRLHDSWEFLSEFQTHDGRLPATTLLVALDETRALAASAVGLFYRIDWPIGGPVSVTQVVTATSNYNFSAFRSGDSLYLGGTGSRVAKASIGPLLEDPPRLVLDEEFALAERPPNIDTAVVSISGDPSGALDLFLMTENTEVFHWDGTRATRLGAMDPRSVPFVPEVDLELRARQLAWVEPGKAIATWFRAENSIGETGPALLSLGAPPRPSPLPSSTDFGIGFSSSAVYQEGLGIYAVWTSFEDGGLRSEIFHKHSLGEDWRSYANLDFAVLDMLPSRSSVFATGAHFMFPEWQGRTVRAQRGFHFDADPEPKRCLWARTGGRQRLAIRMGEKRMISAGTVGREQPLKVHTHEE